MFFKYSLVYVLIKIFSDNEFSFVILDTKCNLKYYKLLISKRNNYQILIAPQCKIVLAKTHFA